MQVKIHILILGIMLVFLTGSFTQAYASQADPENSADFIIRIPYEYIQSVHEIDDIEIASETPFKSIDVIVSSDQLFLIKQQNIPYELIPDLQYNPVAAAAYHSFPEMEHFLQNITEQYPSITDLFSIGSTYENRNIWCLEISDNPGIDEEEPEILFMGVHHAREWPTLEICLHIIENLTSNYEKNPEITSLIQQRRIFVVPCVNPDGYVYDHDEYDGVNWWRKNRHYLPDFNEYGIDLNRNYGGSSNGNPIGMWGSLGMSHNPSSEVYCGAQQFSEYETQAIQRFFINQSICASISWHTYAELVMWPWGYIGDEQTPEASYISQVGQNIASRITNQDETGTYTPTQSAGLYPTTGDTTDWMYGYSHYVLGQPHFSFTIEACTSFHPNQEVLPQVCRENYDGALYLLKEAENISQLTPRVLPPIITNITKKSDQTILLEWMQKNPNAQAERYQLDALSDFYVNTDDSSLSSECWNLTGFTIDSSQGHSPDGCYYSQNKNAMVSSMTTRFPIPITSGMNLSFWCKYNIKQPLDKAFVEISTDGRYYQVLDGFTGLCNEFQYKEYSLEEYVGSSLFIRFRYRADASYGLYGFYVDDIYPVARFDRITTVSDDIREPFFEIDEPVEYQEYYRVRGYNQVFGWGDFSMIHAYNNNPSPPTILGPNSGSFNETYEYSFNAIDPEEDQLYYYIDWGDGTIDEWIGPYESNEVATIEHTWLASGRYVIQAQAKDASGKLSGWSTLRVSMPRERMLFSLPWVLEEFIEQYPFLSYFFNTPLNH